MVSRMHFAKLDVNGVGKQLQMLFISTGIEKVIQVILYLAECLYSISIHSLINRNSIPCFSVK